jgi:hypothetical protein
LKSVRKSAIGIKSASISQKAYSPHREQLHGKIAELERIEEFEDRVVDMALEIGAAVRIWRSSPDHDALRIVRGLIVDVSPGQETTSLLISPEGWQISLHEIEAAENGTLAEPRHCFVKTQFGSIEGHVAVVELYSFLKHEFREWQGHMITATDRFGRPLTTGTVNGRPKPTGRRSADPFNAACHQNGKSSSHAGERICSSMRLCKSARRETSSG